jgi:hypothetical protein
VFADESWYERGILPKLQWFAIKAVGVRRCYGDLRSKGVRGRELLASLDLLPESSESLIVLSKLTLN